MLYFAVLQSSHAVAQDDLNTESVASQIKQLEQNLFAQTLSKDELIPMLDNLADPKTRKDQAWAIAKKARGCQQWIADYANQCNDIDVREMCARIVSYLDDGWRNTNQGKQLLTLYKSDVNSESGFETAWEQFLIHPTNQSAFERVLAAPTATAWNWIEEIQSKKPARNRSKNFDPVKDGRAKYLLLRVRELSPDSFAAKRLGDFKLQSSIPSLFPAHKSNTYGDSYRQVGHVLLKRFEVNTPQPFNFHHSKLYSFYPKQYQLFRADLGKKQVNKGTMLQLVYFDDTAYGPYNIQNGKNLPLTKLQQKLREGTSAGLVNRHQEPASIVIHNRSKQTIVPIINASTEDRERFTYHSMKPAKNGPVPWWWRSFVSSANAKKLDFLKQERGAKAPGVFSDAEVVGLAPTGTPNDVPVAKENAPSFVVLPPRLNLQSEPSQIAAELATDRCAEELQGLSVQVVDRQNLKQILEERQRNGATEPMFSFDAFVRLEILNDQLKPEATLSVVDLSTGSPITSQTFAWPIQEESIRQIRSILKQSISKIKKPDTDQVKVRFLGVRQPEQVRLRTMAIELARKIESKMRKNERVVVVDHIESASAAEESLFLMLGLTRNPSGRAFSPTTDVTIELSMTERDVNGQAFEDTSIDIQTSFTLVGQETQNSTHSNIVREFKSELTSAVWKDIETELESVLPGEMESAPTDLVARRKQAKRELESIRMIDKRLPQIDQAMRRYQLAQTALKLDPTYDEAQLEAAGANANVHRLDKNYPNRNELLIDGMSTVVALTDKCVSDSELFPKLRAAAYSLQSIVDDLKKDKVRAEHLWTLHQEKMEGRKRKSQLDIAKTQRLKEALAKAEQDYQIEPDLRRQFFMDLLRIVEADFETREIGVSNYPSRGAAAKSALISLKDIGESPKELLPRLLGIIEDIERLQQTHDKRYSQLKNSADFRSRLGQRIATEKSALSTFRKDVLAAACELQSTEAFDRLIPERKRDLLSGTSNDWIFELARRDVQPLGDTKRLAEFEAWIKDQKLKKEKPKPKPNRSSNKSPLQFAKLSFPKIDVFANSQPALVKTESFETDSPDGYRIWPLTKTKDRLYFLATNAKAIGWQPDPTPDRDNSIRKFGYVSLVDGVPSGSSKFIKLPPEIRNAKNPWLRCQ